MILITNLHNGNISILLLLKIGRNHFYSLLLEENVYLLFKDDLWIKLLKSVFEIHLQFQNKLCLFFLYFSRLSLSQICLGFIKNLT